MSVLETTVTRRVSLVVDGAVTLAIGGHGLDPAVTSWLPQQREQLTSRHQAAADIVATDRVEPQVRPSRPPTLSLGSVSGWPEESQDLMRLYGASDRHGGTVDFEARKATLWADPASANVGQDLYSMLTLSAALLLAELGRALVHAGGVVSPDGRAWLLVGDARAGKSTTCATLMRAGWGYLSDDQVVLGPSHAHRIPVEGWLRSFHLDQGWPEGRTTRVRTPTPAQTVASARWHRTGTLGGLLFPHVRPDQPTALAAISPGEALGELVRQSPWLFVRREAAGRILPLLQASVEVAPSYRLSLGLDTYREGRTLAIPLSRLPSVKPPR